MKAGLNLIDNFLWETFQIDWRTNIRKKAKNIEEIASTKSNLDKLIKIYALNLQFINRMDRDPGFKQYLLKEIESNNEVIVNLKNYIGGIERKYIGNSFDSLFNLDKIDSNSANLELDRNLKYSFGAQNQKRTKSNNKIRVEFLRNRLKIAELENNLDEKIAIESILMEYKEKFIGCYDLFQKNKSFQKASSKSHNFLNSKGIKYIAENLVFFDVYLEKKNSTILKWIPEPDYSLIHKFSQIHPVKPEINKESINKYGKFCTDSLKISFILWFESKSEEQKLSILNREYEFYVDKNDLKRAIDLHGILKVITISDNLYKANYFFEAKILYEYICKYEIIDKKRDFFQELNLTNKLDVAGKLVDNAEELFGSFQFTKAINYLKRANEVLDSADLNSRIAHCYFYLYLESLNTNEQSKSVECLKCAKKYWGEIQTKDLHKPINKDTVLLAGFCLIAEGLEAGNRTVFEAGIKTLKQHIMFIYLLNSDNHDDIFPTLKYCLIHLMQLKNRKMLKIIFDELVIEIEKYEKLTSPYLLIGLVFIQYFIEDIALLYFDEGLKKETDSTRRSHLFDIKGYLNISMAQTKEAIECYEKALDIDDTNYEFWFSLSIAYSYSLQYSKAKKCMEQSILFMPIDSERFTPAQNLIKKFSQLSKKQIDLESLTEDRVKSTLVSAEMEFLESNNPDYSGALVKYSKAIQIVMEDNVSKPIFNKILSCNKISMIKKYTQNKQNPLLFTMILQKNKSAGLGAWRWTKSEVEKPIKDNLSLEIKNELLNIIDPEIIDSLECLGKILQPQRNVGSHENIITIDNATEVRNKAIPYINKIISHFY